MLNFHLLWVYHLLRCVFMELNEDQLSLTFHPTLIVQHIFCFTFTWFCIFAAFTISRKFLRRHSSFLENLLFSFSCLFIFLYTSLYLVPQYSILDLLSMFTSLFVRYMSMSPVYISCPNLLSKL